MTLAAWLHDLDPFAVRFFDDVGLRWYGLAYIGGFVVGWLILRALAKRGRILLSPQQVGDALLALVVGVLVGGRLGYVLFYQPSLLWAFSAGPPWWGAAAINRGGMASHGGMLGVVLACLWIARRARVPSLHVMDIVALGAPVGLFFGRIANFINGELLGRIVAPPGESAPAWAVKFPQELLTRHRPRLDQDQTAQLRSLFDQTAPGWRDLPPRRGYAEAASQLIDAVQKGVGNVAQDLAPLISARHPSQLYQALAEGPILAAVLWTVWARPRKPGVVGAWFLMAYGVLRIVTEFWRLPDDHLETARILGLSRGQWLSAAMVVAGLIMLLLLRRLSRAEPVGGWKAPPRTTKPPVEHTAGGEDQSGAD